MVAYLHKEKGLVIDKTVEILKERILKFNGSKPKVQVDRTTGRILVEFRGTNDTGRMQSLLKNSGNLEFYETYSLTEMVDFLSEADNIVSVNSKDTTPLLSMLFSSGLTTQGGMYATIGYVPVKDTARLMALLNMPEVKTIFPEDVKWAWSAKSLRNTDLYELYALRVTGIKEHEAFLSGDIIEDAESDIDNRANVYVVALDMNEQAAMDWARMTKEASSNPGDQREIAIVVDNVVYTAPTVLNEIPSGKSQIAGNFTEAEADDLANLLKAGRLPVELTILTMKNVGRK